MGRTRNLPREIRRKRAHATMTPALREVAGKIDKKLRVISRGTVLLSYEIGTLVREVLAQEDRYGTEAVHQLGEYLGIKGGSDALFALWCLTAKFDREELEEEVIRPMASGEYLSVAHFLELIRELPGKRRQALLDLTRAKCLSAAQLRREIAGKDRGAKSSAKSSR